MKKLFRCMAGCLLAGGMVLMSGCASMFSSSVMTTVQPMTAPTQTEAATVVFMRPTMFGGAIKFGLWDSDKFIGILEQQSYIQYETTPGEHLFLARAENWSAVKATLQPGKNYFILGKVFPGIWRARVAYDPIEKGDKITDAEIKAWLAKLKPRSPDASKVSAYVNPRLTDVRAAVKKFESGKGKAETMGPDDFRMIN